MSLMRNNCQLLVTGDGVFVPGATQAFQNTKEMQSSHEEMHCNALNRNNQPKSLIFLSRLRIEYKTFSCRNVCVGTACDINHATEIIVKNQN